MLDFLVPDELEWFRWLIGGGIMEEESAAVGSRSNRPRTWRLLEKKIGTKQEENMAKKVLSRIVPALSRSRDAPASCLHAQLCYIFVEPAA